MVIPFLRHHCYRWQAWRDRSENMFPPFCSHMLPQNGSSFSRGPECCSNVLWMPWLQKILLIVVGSLCVTSSLEVSSDLLFKSHCTCPPSFQGGIRLYYRGSGGARCPICSKTAAGGSTTLIRPKNLDSVSLVSWKNLKLITSESVGVGGAGEQVTVLDRLLTTCQSLRLTLVLCYFLW